MITMMTSFWENDHAILSPKNQIRNTICSSKHVPSPMFSADLFMWPVGHEQAAAFLGRLMHTKTELFSPYEMAYTDSHDVMTIAHFDSSHIPGLVN